MMSLLKVKPFQWSKC